MKNTFVLIAVAASLATSPAWAAKKEAAKKAAPAATASKEITLDTAASKVAWLGKKVTGQHNGSVQIKEGKIQVADGKITGGTVVIDLDTITVEDLKDPGYNAKLVGHLKNDDFFGVTSGHRYAELTITSAKAIAGAKAGEPNTEFTGDMTIKKITKPVTFKALVNLEGGKAEATGKIELDRTLWDIKYGSGKFFENLGDKMINDTFTLDVTAVGKM